MKQLVELPLSKKFSELGKPVLRSRLENLLNCKVFIQYKPIEHYKKEYNVDITENIQRGYYVIDEDTSILICRILKEKEIIAVFGITLKGNRIASYSSKQMNYIASSISGVSSESYRTKFTDSIIAFDEYLIRRIIANSVCKGRYERRKILYLLEYLNRLRSLTFEGEHFSTGLIITRSSYAFRGKGDNDRKGQLLRLSRSFNLIRENEIKKRKWFLVDGKSSFFLSDRHLNVNTMFLINKNSKGLANYIDYYTLQNTLYGGDVAFRAINHTQFSFLTSFKTEFINIDNNWRMRDYVFIEETF